MQIEFQIERRHGMFSGQLLYVWAGGVQCGSRESETHRQGRDSV